VAIGGILVVSVVVARGHRWRW